MEFCPLDSSLHNQLSKVTLPYIRGKISSLHRDPPSLQQPYGKPESQSHCQKQVPILVETHAAAAVVETGAAPARADPVPEYRRRHSRIRRRRRVRPRIHRRRASAGVRRRRPRIAEINNKKTSQA